MFVGLDIFFGNEKKRPEIIKSVLNKLRSIEDWFQNQRKFAFYSSSILIVFEGDSTSVQTPKKLRRHLSRPPLTHRESNVLTNAKSCIDVNCPTERQWRGSFHRSLSENAWNSNRTDDENSKNNDENNKDNDVELKMIDFTHVWNTEQQDQNYLFGLQNVIHHVELLLER